MNSMNARIAASYAQNGATLDFSTSYLIEGALGALASVQSFTGNSARRLIDFNTDSPRFVANGAFEARAPLPAPVSLQQTFKSEPQESRR